MEVNRDRGSLKFKDQITGSLKILVDITRIVCYNTGMLETSKQMYHPNPNKGDYHGQYRNRCRRD